MDVAVQGDFATLAEQQIILWAFGYLTPPKLSQLGKIVFLFFGLSKDTPKMKI